MEEAAELPTVATIIGCPQELDTQGLVATPLGVPGPMGGEPSDDPIQKALLETMCKGFVSKKERDIMYCSICDVTCTGEQAYKAHVAGAKHAKKSKDRSAEVDVNNEPFIFEDQINKTFECMLCNVKLNAKNQIAAHIQGVKHKARLEPNEKIYAASGRNILDPHRKIRFPSYEMRTEEEDLSLSLLYCATCDVQANSTLQMEQHMASAKHVNKVNSGGMGFGPERPSRPYGPPAPPGPPGPPGRFMPYPYKDRDPYYDYDDYDRERYYRALSRENDYGRGGEGGFWARERYIADRYGDDRYVDERYVEDRYMDSRYRDYVDHYSNRNNYRYGFDRPSGRGMGYSY